MKRKTRLPNVVNCSITKNFIQIPNNLLKDPNISFEAKGIYGALLLNENLDDLLKFCKEDRNVIESAINELEVNGYLKSVNHEEK